MKRSEENEIYHYLSKSQEEAGFRRDEMMYDLKNDVEDLRTDYENSFNRSKICLKELNNAANLKHEELIITNI